MKTILALTLLFLLLGSAAEAAKLSVRDLPGKRVMILGDSITQDGRYVAFIEYYLEKQFPKADFDIINMGLSSETTCGLSEPGHAGGAFPRPCVHERLGRALKKVKPKIVFACYGMNDGLCQGPDPARFDAYHKGITKLVQQAQTAGARVVLITPPIFDTANAGFPHYDGYDDVLAEFGKWIMAAPFKDVLRIDLHTAMKSDFQARRKADPNFYYAQDGVHPNDLGHLVMAQAILKGIGAKAPEGDLNAELAKVTSDPLYKMIYDRSIARAGAWMAYVGYTRERFVPEGNDISPGEQQAADAQKQIDALRRK